MRESEREKMRESEREKMRESESLRESKINRNKNIC
jgi:hypothetical protein